MSDMITLKEYADRFITPAMLRLLGWPDDEEHRILLDMLVQALPDEED